jgi:hypothetical protein
VLIIERMLMIPDKFIDIDEIILYKRIILMYNLKMVNIFTLAYTTFFYP